MAPTPAEMEHQIGRDALAPTLYTALTVERVLCATKLMEYIEGFEADCERFF